MQKLVEINKALKRKYPEQIVIVTAKDGNGKHNPITLGWHMRTSIKPPMLAISVGLARYTYGCIRESKEFVVTHPSLQMMDAVKFYGSRTGRKCDKLAEMPCVTTAATKIDSLIYTDAVINFECTLQSELISGDHAIFVGEVVAAHVHENDDLKNLFSIKSGVMGEL